VLAAFGLVLAACSSPSPPSPSGPGVIPGWRLTLPEEGDSGNADTVDPAVLSPPWLTRDAAGQLTFWAPVQGATTRNSEHARTELSSNDNFQAGDGQHELRASLTIAQVPPESRDVIIGQIHGAGDIISVPFVMLHYTAGDVHVVVKQEQSGDAATKLPLLTGVPLGAPFDYALRDNGDGSLTVSAGYGDQRASVDTPLPPAFRDATVRFQAGAYQQDSTESDAGGPDDGARITFSTLATTSATAAPLPAA
jgi:Alginate lyase